MSVWTREPKGLFSDPGWESSSVIWPKLGTWDLGFAYEQPMSELLTVENESSSSPVTLLPTPGANDSTGAEAEPRQRRQQEGKTGEPSLRDLPKLLLPTPTTQDAANNGGPSQHRRNSDPLNVVAQKLLPTPTAGDAKASGSRNLPGSKAHAGVSLTDAVRFGNSETSRLLPTPMANSENPGAGGELRAALTHGEGRRNRTGIDSWGRANQGRTTGEPTSPPSPDGSLSPDLHPDQLTIEDA